MLLNSISSWQSSNCVNGYRSRRIPIWCVSVIKQPRLIWLSPLSGSYCPSNRLLRLVYATDNRNTACFFLTLCQQQWRKKGEPRWKWNAHMYDKTGTLSKAVLILDQKRRLYLVRSPASFSSVAPFDVRSRYKTIVYRVTFVCRVSVHYEATDWGNRKNQLMHGLRVSYSVFLTKATTNVQFLWADYRHSREILLFLIYINLHVSSKEQFSFKQTIWITEKNVLSIILLICRFRLYLAIRGKWFYAK